MAERRRFVTIHPTSGTVTTVLDVDDGTNYTMDRGTFNVTPGALKPIVADRQRRFGGSGQVGELQDNGTIEWIANARGASSDASLTNVETLFSTIRGGRTDLFFEWRPENATNSTYYEVRGAATITPQYQWVMLAGAKLFKHQVSVPVGPLARGDAYDIAIGSTTLPAVVQLSSAITGTAPALADVKLTNAAWPAAGIPWALFSWIKRAGSPLSGTSVPFGLFEAESGTMSFFGSVADGGASGGNLAQLTASGAGTGATTIAIDPSTLTADDFSDEVLLEVWARVRMGSGIVAPTLTGRVYQWGSTLSNRGNYNYSLEWFSTPRAILATLSTTYRIFRVGTFTLPVDKIAPAKWALAVELGWAAGSSGVIGIDTLIVNPVRARALGPTGRVKVTPTYPFFLQFFGSTLSATKLIRGADLSGYSALSSDPLARSAGLGGSPIELPPGNVDMLLKLGSEAPDDPSNTGTTETLSFASVTGNVRVTPRYYLVKGA